MAALAYAAVKMKINPKDYLSNFARKTALNEIWEFGRELKVYLKRVLFGLDRDCARRDYFIGTQIYQAEDLAIVQEDGYSGFENYDDDMPGASYPIAGLRQIAGIKLSGTAGMQYQVGGNWSQPFAVIDETTDGHQDAVYADGTALIAKYYGTSDYTGSFVVGTNPITLTSNAASATTLVAPAGMTFNPAYVDMTPVTRARNGVLYRAPGTTDSTLFAAIFNTSPLTPNIKPFFAYYDDAAAQGASIAINFVFNSDITASDYTAKIQVIQAVSNSVPLSMDLNATYTVQAQGTVLPTSITFTKADVSSNVQHPLFIEISNITLV